MWKLQAEGLALPEAVLCCGRDGACPREAVPLPGVAENSVGAAKGVWLAKRWSRTLLMCVS